MDSAILLSSYEKKGHHINDLNDYHQNSYFFTFKGFLTHINGVLKHFIDSKYLPHITYLLFSLETVFIIL